MADFLMACDSINADINTNVQNNEGNTSLHLAYGSGFVLDVNDTAKLSHLYNFLQRDVVPSRKLNDVCYGEANDMITQLMDRAQALASIPNHDGDTPVHLACRHGDMPRLQVLIGTAYARESIDATWRNKDGDTPLHLVREDVDMVKLLLNSANVKTDVNLRNRNGDTPLHCAAKQNAHELVDYLLTVEGIDPNVQNSFGNTALHCASARGSCDIVMEMIQCSAKVDRNIRNHDGNTPSEVSRQPRPAVVAAVRQRKRAKVDRS
uniref:Uncharacterized protein n=1 Tax=Craspedostauros australis TaxID=1486917 RepID=A0A7R9ZRY0_9STRA